MKLNFSGQDFIIGYVLNFFFLTFEFGVSVTPENFARTNRLPSCLSFFSLFSVWTLVDNKGIRTFSMAGEIISGIFSVYML